MAECFPRELAWTTQMPRTPTARDLDRDAVRQALDSEPSPDWDLLAAALRKQTSDRKHTPAEVLLRESRDER